MSRPGRWRVRALGVAGVLAVLTLTTGPALCEAPPGGGIPAANEIMTVNQNNAAPAEDKLPWDPEPPAAAAFARVAAITALGRALFFDKALSASGQMACATCHDPAHGHGPPDAAAVRMGGARLDQPGTRTVPNLGYAQFSPFFDEHHYEDDDGDEGLDAGPTGGLTWDGRVNRARDQARIPLLAPNEMANTSEADVVARAAASPEAAELRALHGETIFADVPRAFAAIAEALEIYQQDPPTFSPFTSKFDAFLRGEAALDATELRGLQAFNDPDKGNCAHCHKSRLGGRGGLPLFTDYGLVAIGAPRNPAIPANADPAYFDLGLCGPVRRDMADHPKYCGLFKTPSLRNVALRPVFFHNGVFRTLHDAVAFYADRDIDPARWYPTGPDGAVRIYNDLPAEYHENVNVEPPFDRHPGDAPALSENDVADIVAFLMTLTDGYPQARGPGRSISTQRGTK